MLNLSARQLQTLDATLGERLYARLEALVHELRPDLHSRVDPQLMRQFIEMVRGQADGLGFRSEFELGVFLSAVLLQGRDFHLNPAHPLAEVVTRPHVEPHLRANQLLYELERLPGNRTAATQAA